MEQKLRKLVIALATLGVAAFLANLLVDNPYTHKVLRTGLNAIVTKKTNLLVDFKAVKLSVVPPGVDLYGAYVAPVSHPNEPLVTASHVKARISIWTLILGHVKLARFEADDLAVVWPPPWDFAGVLKDDGVVGPPPTTHAVWPPDVNLPIDRVELRNAKIFLQLPTFAVPQPAKDVTVSVVGLDIDGAVHSWRDIEAQVTAKAIDLAIGPVSMLEDTSLDVSLELVSEHIAATKLKLAGPRVNYDGSALVNFNVADKTHILSSLDLETTGDVRGDFSLLGSFLDLPDTRGAVTGEVEVKAKVPVEDSGDPAFAVSGKGRVHDARLYGFRLFNSEAEFAINESAVTFPLLRVIIGDDEVARGSGTIKLDDAIDFDFKAQPHGLPLLGLLEALKVDVDVVDTNLSAPDLHIHGTGSPTRINVAATAQASNITLPATPYDHTPYTVSPACRIGLRLTVTSEALDFNGTRGTCFQPATAAEPPMPTPGATEPPPGMAAASPVELSGKIGLADVTTLGLQVHAALDLALGQYFAEIPLAGSGTADVKIHGPTSHMLIDAHVAANGTKVLGMPLGQVSANVNVDPSTRLVSWQDVAARPEDGGRIDVKKGQLDVHAEPYRLKTQVSASDVSEESVHALVASVAPDVDFGVAVKSLEGNYDTLLFAPLAGTGEVKVALADAAYEGETLFDTATAHITASPKGFTADPVVVTLGTLAIQGKLKHTRATPLTAQVAADTHAPLLVRAGLSSRDQFEAEFATLGGGDAPLPDAGAPPAADAATSPGAAAKAAKDEDDPKDHLGRLPFVGDTLKSVGIKGRIVAQGKVTGSVSELQGTFNGSIDRPSVFGAAMSPVNFRGFLKDSRLDLVLDHSGNALEGRLSLDLRKDGIPYEWFFNLNRMDLRALGTPYFSGDARNYIYLTADWRMQGTFRDWWRSTGELNIKDLRGKYVQDISAQTKTLQFRQEEPVKLLFTDKGWRFADDKDLYLTGRDVQLRLSLDGSHPPERLGLKAEGIADISILRDLTQAIDTAEGKLKIIAEIPGSTSDPKPTLEITDLQNNPFIAATWKPVSIGLADARPAFRNVHLRILYRDGRFIVDKLAADKGSGTMTAAGVWNVANNEGSRVDVNFNNATMIVPVAVLKSFETEVTGNLVLSGSDFPYRLAGDIVVNKARSTREMDIRDEIINALRQKSFNTSLVAEKPTLLLDLNVTADQSINIHNRNLQMLLSSDVHVRGTDIQPAVSGQVEVDKGKFNYNNRDFKFTRGVVTFDDPVKPDPALDILAVSDVDVYRVYIAVSGRASDPKVELSVDPPNRETGQPISEIEILVLLSRGKLPDDSRSIGADSSGALASQTANLFLGQFEEPFEKLLGASGQNVVRNVYINSHPAPDGSPVPQLNLPIDLSEDVDFVIRRDLSNTAPVEEASLEYNINDNINVSGTVQRNSQEAASTIDQAALEQTQTNLIDRDAKVNLKFRFSFE